MTTVGEQHRQARKEIIMQHRRRLQIFQAAKRPAFNQSHQPETEKNSIHHYGRAIYTSGSTTL